ncbi:type IV secretion system protein (plasmid) [Edwardsiella tarda]|uniref:type IV secretion system protein n=1 Tax=Edwardsiella tarda TaxID=636 RepID=UPI000D5202B0|nr:type IV secretion system protein [Edwardsiella tarda]UCQ29612.1 type IV secretion system protein [Edwardsiella tarda]
MNIVSTFLSTVKGLVESGAASNASKIANAISPVFFAAIGVYVIFIAYTIIYSQRDVVMNEVTKTIMAFTAVGAFTYSAPYYANYVIPFVMNAGQDLSNAITGNSDVATSVDDLWDSLSMTMNEFLKTEKEKLDMLDIGGMIAIYLTWAIGYIGGAILIFYTSVFLTVSLFMVGVLLSVGVLFICFSVFSTTRNMFTAWCGSCLNYILLNVFYTISFGFVLNLIKSLAVSNPDSVTMGSVITLLLVIVISVFLIEQIGTLCSTLTGGVGINGLTSAANGMMGKMATASGLRAVGNITRGFMGKMAKSGASKALGAARNMRKNIIGG